MKLSSREEYGLRFLVQIARKGPRGSLTIPQLAELEGVSEANVAKTLRMLRQAALVESTRGQLGGYCLAHPASRIRIGEVIALLGGPLFDANFCRKFGGPTSPCRHDSNCSVRGVWKRVRGAVELALADLTLQDLLGSEAQIERPAVPEAPRSC